MGTQKLARAAVLVSGDPPQSKLDDARSQITAVLVRIFGEGTAAVVVKSDPSVTGEREMKLPEGVKPVKSNFRGELDPD